MRNALVTGGTKGLGLAIACRLASEGLRVVAVARSDHSGFHEAAAGIGASQTGSLHFRPFDLNDLDNIGDFVRSMVKEFGPLYAVINNAGIGTSGLLATMPDRQIDALLRLNIAAPIKLTRHAVRAMMVGGCGGRIVNMSSIVASSGANGLSVYAATKASLTGFTQSLAREVGPLGITVNCVAPGIVATEMTADMSARDRDRAARKNALRRMPVPDDVAHAVAYLVSDGARNVTGTTLTVDAGNTA